MACVHKSIFCIFIPNYQNLDLVFGSLQDPIGYKLFITLWAILCIYIVLKTFYSKSAFQNWKVHSLGSGSDQIKPIVLKTLHAEQAPILQTVFHRFLETGKLPTIWKQASITPIFKKGEKLKSSNYRPISPTCILCKTLEHIVASSIVKHFDQQHIFFELQHGFREKDPVKHEW